MKPEHRHLEREFGFPANGITTEDQYRFFNEVSGVSRAATVPVTVGQAFEVIAKPQLSDSAFLLSGVLGRSIFGRGPQVTVGEKFFHDPAFPLGGALALVDRLNDRFTTSDEPLTHADIELGFDYYEAAYYSSMMCTHGLDVLVPILAFISYFMEGNHVEELAAKGPRSVGQSDLCALYIVGKDNSRLFGQIRAGASIMVAAAAKSALQSSMASVRLYEPFDFNLFKSFTGHNYSVYLSKLGRDVRGLSLKKKQGGVINLQIVQDPTFGVKGVYLCGEDLTYLDETKINGIIYPLVDFSSSRSVTVDFRILQHLLGLMGLPSRMFNQRTFSLASRLIVPAIIRRLDAFYAVPPLLYTEPQKNPPPGFDKPRPHNKDVSLSGLAKTAFNVPKLSDIEKLLVLNLQNPTPPPEVKPFSQLRQILSSIE